MLVNKDFSLYSFHLIVLPESTNLLYYGQNKFSWYVFEYEIHFTLAHMVLTAHAIDSGISSGG